MNLLNILQSILTYMNCQFQKPAKKELKKEPSTSKVPASKKKSKEVDEDGPKKKKPKKKKDPNAPKRAMPGFMFFSQMEREVGLVWVWQDAFSKWFRFSVDFRVA